MQTSTNTSATPSRILYTMFRISNLESSIQFYEKALGMREQRRETFTEGRFTLVFMGYGDMQNNATIELTYNWDQDHYQHGTRYGHVALEVNDIYAACKRISQNGYTVLRDPGPMIYAADKTKHKETIAFIEDPDGYKIELIQT